MKNYRMYVNNEWVRATSTRKIINPATGEVLATVPEAGKVDVDNAVASARTAFDATNWRESSNAMARGRVLFKMAQLVRDNATMLAELETLNCGKPIVESEFDMNDVATCLEYFGGLATKVHNQPTPKKIKTAEPVAPPAVVTELSAHKFEVAPAKQQPKQVFIEENLGELPDSYGTGRLFLAARDPHWVFAYWDFTGAQLADFRRRSSDNRVVLRLFEQNHRAPLEEVTLAHDARNWYLPAPKAAASYHAELGYWQPDGHFHVVSRSRETTTPPAGLSADTTARFASIPVDLPFTELLGMVRTHLHGGERLAEALQRLQAEGFQFPFRVDIELGPWTAAQGAAVQRAVGGDVLRTTKIGSLDFSEWLRRRLLEETSSGLSSGFSPSGASWSGQPQPGQFWFAVNAELIIYGATEPDAKVTVDGKPVTLRSDGTFSFHYALPDGKYQLPVVAISGKTGERRQAALQFERRTQTTEIGRAHV